MSYLIFRGNEQETVEVSYGNPLPTVPTVVTTAYRKLATADTNLDVVKANSGRLYSTNITNVSADTVYLKIYNKETDPVLSSDTPVVAIPVTAGASLNHTFAGDVGLTFSTGIAIAITGGIDDTDTTVLTLNSVILTLVYS